MNKPSNKNNWVINQDRLWGDIEALAAITEPNMPYTRRSFSEMFLKGRTYLTKAFQNAGLQTKIDENGNLIGHLQGSEPALGTLMIGSHSDTVPSGGRFDGIAGVVAGLEIIRSLKDAGIQLKHNLEIIDCLAEEVSEFGLSCIGSRGLTGFLEPQMLSYKHENGELLGQAISRMGGQPTAITQQARTDIKGFLELHIEQGRVLENEALDIGVVTTIVGITRIEISIIGLPDHAGTTPMHYRKDALSGAVDIIAGIRDKAKEIARTNDDYFVATTGEIRMQPNAANVVPSRVDIVIDARAQTRSLMQTFLDYVKIELPKLALQHEVSVADIKILSDSLHTECDKDIVNLLTQTANDLGLKSKQMTSGAGHDAVFFSRIAPAAMVFVPCDNGRSHCPEEWSSAKQLAMGTGVLFEALKKLDNS